MDVGENVIVWNIVILPSASIINITNYMITAMRP